MTTFFMKPGIRIVRVRSASTWAFFLAIHPDGHVSVVDHERAAAQRGPRGFPAPPALVRATLVAVTSGLIAAQRNVIAVQALGLSDTEIDVLFGAVDDLLARILYEGLAEHEQSSSMVEARPSAAAFWAREPSASID